jgi:arylsulfatase A
MARDSRSGFVNIPDLCEQEICWPSERPGTPSVAGTDHVAARLCERASEQTVEASFLNFLREDRIHGEILLLMHTRSGLVLQLSFLSVLLSLTFSNGHAAKREELPNIVIIFTDDQGYADVGVFGAKGFRTPNLDRLASQGGVFKNFHVAQPVCSASRTALLTGCYPNRLGIHGALGPRSKVGISDHEVTLAELVKQRGYATAIFGKWHLGDAPQFLPVRHGFDEYFGLPYSNDMWPSHPDLAKLPPEAERRKRGYPDLLMYDGDKVAIPQITPEHQNQLTTWYTERAVSFIERNKERPFFLYLAHSMPHVPLHVSDKFRGKSGQGLYGDVIEEIDWSVGQVMDALERAGVAKNTWIIFTSDNGPWLSYGEHGGSAYPLREGKGTCWEGGTRVPCIMRFPGKISPGTKSEQMLMSIDLLPTIARLIGAKLPKHPIDGMDVWPIISGKRGAKNPHKAYYFYFDVNSLQAIATGDGRWKLHLPHTYRTLGGKPGGKGGTPVSYQQVKIEKPQLYNLETDIEESQDVASEHPDIVKKLEMEAEKARQELGDQLTKRTGVAVREPGRLQENSVQ